MTQAGSVNEAHVMVEDRLETLVNLLGFSVRVNPVPFKVRAEPMLERSPSVYDECSQRRVSCWSGSKQVRSLHTIPLKDSGPPFS